MTMGMQIDSWMQCVCVRFFINNVFFFLGLCLVDFVDPPSRSLAKSKFCATVLYVVRVMHVRGVVVYFDRKSSPVCSQVRLFGF